MKELAKNQAVSLYVEFREANASHKQPLLTRTGEINSLIVQIIRAQETAENAEYERDGSIAQLQHLQGGQQQYQAALSHAQGDTAAMVLSSRMIVASWWIS